MDSSHPLISQVLIGKRPFEDLERFLLAEDRRFQPAVFRSSHEGLAHVLEAYREFEKFVFAEIRQNEDTLLAVARLMSVCHRFAEDVLHVKAQ